MQFNRRSRAVLAVAVFLTSSLGLTARASLIDGVGAIGDGGASGSSTGKYPGMLQATRGLNFGGPTTPYNFATVGATSTTVLNPGGQVAQLAAQVQSGNVTFAFMYIGDNDLVNNAFAVANGSLNGAALVAAQNLLIQNIETGVNTVMAAGGKIVMGGVSDAVHTPFTAAINADPTKKALVEGVNSAIESQLMAFAASKGIPFIDFFGLEKSIFDSGQFVVGGVNISLTNVGPDPHNFFQDNLNAGIVIRAEIANLWLQALKGYVVNIPLLSDQEILNLAGIGNEYHGETFIAASHLTDFAHFTTPEPSSVTLLAIGLAAITASLLRRRGWVARR